MAKKYLISVSITAEAWIVGTDEDDAAAKAIDQVFSNPHQDISVDAHAIEELGCDAEDFYDE